MNWNFFLPVKLFFGCGRIQELNAILTELNLNNGILICDPVFVGNGMAQKVIDCSNGKLSGIFSDVMPNPTVENADDCAAVIRKYNAKFAVALGGGSSIDCAKAACSIAKADDSIRNYHSGGKPLNEGFTIPLLAIPTTAGTGSEVTSVTVLTDIIKHLKAPLGNPLLYPRAAIIDPALTLSVPPGVTASTGLDVLSHALEGFWSIHHQPICDALAVAAIKLVFKFLKKAYDEPANLEAREALSEASLLAGIAFSHPKTSGPHACSFPLTNIYQVPHGEACAFTLAAFLRLNAQAESGRLHTLARECGFENAYLMADRIDELKSGMGMRTTLSEIGIPDDLVHSLAENSMHPNMLNNPVKMDVDSVEKLYLSLR